MTKYGIGYTIFKFEDRVKVPVDMVRVKPGNLSNEVAKLEKRIRKLRESKEFSLCFWMFMYGFSFRVLLSL